MNNNAIERTGNNEKALKALDDEWCLMNAALERLGQVEAREGRQATARRGGRLILGLDLTGSREPTLHQARIATAAMLDTIKAVGAVAVKLIFFRGSECRAGHWHDDPCVVSAAMLRLSCRTGYTRIGKMLRFALDEKERLSGLVLIFDHCEENADELAALAHNLGVRKIPIFVFHECADHDARSQEARPVFERMAALSGGVYTEFRPDSGATLRELLATVAVFSAAGHEGLRKVGQPLTPEARQLRGRLLLAPPRGEGGLLTGGNSKGGSK